MKVKTLFVTTAITAFAIYAQANTTYKKTETTDSSVGSSATVKDTDTTYDSTLDATSAPATRSTTTTVKTTTPSVTDQSAGSTQDVEVTRTIRKELNENNNFSTSAKNIEVITLNNTITLRGKVASEAEKSQVASVAQSAAGTRTINNELVVDTSRK